MVDRAGFDVVRRRYCMLGPLQKVLSRVMRCPFNSTLATRLDSLGCALTAWYRSYHATKAVQKLRPGSVYLVLRKR